jgi:hypothetical protein
VHLLRALVVVPTRDLAVQVRPARPSPPPLPMAPASQRVQGPGLRLRHCGRRLALLHSGPHLCATAACGVGARPARLTQQQRWLTGLPSPPPSPHPPSPGRRCTNSSAAWPPAAASGRGWRRRRPPWRRRRPRWWGPRAAWPRGWTCWSPPRAG